MQRLPQFSVVLVFACLAAVGFGAVTGLILRHAREPQDLVRERRDRLELEMRLVELRVLLWQIGAVVASADAESFDERLNIAANRLRETAGDVLHARLLPGPRAAHDFAAQAADAGSGFTHLSREAPEAAHLIRRELARLVGEVDQRLAHDIARLHESSRRERVLEAVRRQGLGLAAWLFVLPVTAVLGIAWKSRSTPSSAPSPPPQAPPQQAPEDGYAFLERTFQQGADPVLQATAQEQAAIPQCLLQTFLATTRWAVLLLEKTPGAAEPTVVWAGSDNGLLGPAGSTAPLGKSLTDLFPDRADALRAVLATTAPGTSRRSEIDLGTRDAPRFCELIAVHAEGGPLERLLVAVRSIDGERALTVEVEQMRMKLQRAEERAKEFTLARKQLDEKRRDLIAASGAVGLEFELKPDNRSIVILDAGAGVAALHETTDEALLGDSSLLFKHVAAVDRPRVAEALQVAATELKRLDVSYGLALPSGAERWIHLCALPRKTPQQWTRFTALVWDVTEEHRAAEFSARQERLLRVLQNLADADPLPAFGIDRSSKDQVVYVNAAACAHFGFTAEELLQVQIENLDTGFTEAIRSIPPGATAFTLTGSHETARGQVAVTVDYRRCGDLLAGRIRSA